MKKKYIYLIIIFLILATCAAFGRIVDNNFINLDDPGYLTYNDHVQSGLNSKNIQWSFTAVVVANWHPLTLISHTLDWSLFGENASGHHIVSLFLHIGTVLFLFLFLYKSTHHLWPSVFITALFALHPLRVESVAWAAERKDVLSMFFGMSCLYAYSFYCEKSKLSRYLLCLTLFILSLLSKPMLVTLPFILMLLDFWPFDRWKRVRIDKGTPIHLTERLILEKIPFICLSVASSIITLWAQNKGGAITSLKSLPLIERISNAIVSYAAYLGKFFWPVNLAVFYPYVPPLPLSEIVGSATIIILITVISISLVKNFPFLLVGWFWYLGSLIPVIGLIQVGQQAMADRYTYLPSIGLAIMLAWGVSSLIKSKNIQKNLLFPIAIVMSIILSLLSWKQCGYWKDSITLFSHTLRLTKNNNMAHLSLGLALAEKEKFAEAIHHYDEAIRLAPDADAYNNRGAAYFKMGQDLKAIEDFNKAVHLKANYADAYNNRGATYFKMGQHLKAIEDFNKVVDIKADDAEVYFKRASVFEKIGRYQSALEDFNIALHLKPSNIEYRYSRGLVYGKLCWYQRAFEDFNEVIRLKPDHADALNNRGICYDETGHPESAHADFNKAIRLKPNNADALKNRAVFYFKRDNKKLGCKDAQKACTLGNCNTLEIAHKKGYCQPCN